jgi:hypothetical protein
MSFADVVVLMVMSFAFLIAIAHQVTRGSDLAEARVSADRRRAGRGRNGSVRR